MRNILFSLVIVLLILGCANPKLSDVENDEVDVVEESEDLFKTFVLESGQTSAFTYGDDFIVVETIYVSNNYVDVEINSDSYRLVSRQPIEVDGLWYMITWTSTALGSNLAGLIVSTSEIETDEDGPAPPHTGTSNDGIDPHPHGYYDNYGDVIDGVVRVYDYSYGNNPSAGDSIIVSVKLNTSSAGTHLLRVALNDNSGVVEVDLPIGNSIYLVPLDISSSIEAEWHKMRITVMEGDGSIVFNKKNFWIRVVD